MIAARKLLKPGAMHLIVSVAMICLITSDGRAQSDWMLKKDEDGIKVYTGKTLNSNFKSVKVECTVNATLSQLVTFLLDVAHQHDWVYCNKSTQLIKKIGSNEIVFYAEVDVPWPCTNRDYISHITMSQPASQTLMIEARTEPDLLPERKGKIRVKNSRAHWEVTSVTKELQKIVYTVQFDPAGIMPAWLVNMFVTKGPLQTFQKLRECVSRPEYRNAYVDFIKQ